MQAVFASAGAAEYVDIDVPAWMWLALLAFIVVLLLVDLLVIHREAHEIVDAGGGHRVRGLDRHRPRVHVRHVGGCSAAARRASTSRAT